jgi:hypothetical protein
MCYHLVAGVHYPPWSLPQVLAHRGAFSIPHYRTGVLSWQIATVPDRPGSAQGPSGAGLSKLRGDRPCSSLCPHPRGAGLGCAGAEEVERGDAVVLGSAGL